VKRLRIVPAPGGAAALAWLLVIVTLLPAATTAAAKDDPSGKAARPAAVTFRMGDWQLQQVPWARLPLNGGPAMPFETVGPQDREGIPMRRFGAQKKLVYNPTVLAQQGMKRLDAWRQTGETAHLRIARKIAVKLDEISVEVRQRRWQPHEYDLIEQESGWVNANSHGLVQSFLSRFYALTGSAGRLKDARRMMAAYEQRPGDPRWFTLVSRNDYLWFEHWPHGRSVHTLNAHINALFGLYDYWSQTGSPKAERYFLGGAKTVRDQLDRFRRKGRLSRYSLSSKAANLHYHHTHIRQLRSLARMTGDDWFARKAKLLERDEKQWRASGRPD
jgi:hypothetical protein